MFKKFIYFDNNATTKACDSAKKVMTDWIQCCSNPSSSSWLGGASKKLIEQSFKEINEICNTQNYYIVFTSGASESNCTIINMVLDSYARLSSKKPHIISSQIEHKSILECLESKYADGKISLTLIEPTVYGNIDPDDVLKAITPDTILITIMAANNETGAINPIGKISKIAHSKNIPFHTDAVQLFGKTKLDCVQLGIDALSMSAHKIYGPTGIGLLIIRKKFAEGYNFRGIISGTQQFGLRGGTENIVGIAGLTAALAENFSNRKKKNEHLLKLRHALIESLPYEVVNFHPDIKYDTLKIVLFGPTKDENVLPSTALISVLHPKMCNVKLKKMLEDKGFIVSIGSACNTSSKSASHVLTALHASPEIKKGVLRISFGDHNTFGEIKLFVKALKDSVESIIKH